MCVCASTVVRQVIECRFAFLSPAQVEALLRIVANQNELSFEDDFMLLPGSMPGPLSLHAFLPVSLLFEYQILCFIFSVCLLVSPLSSSLWLSVDLLYVCLRIVYLFVCGLCCLGVHSRLSPLSSLSAAGPFNLSQKANTTLSTSTQCVPCLNFDLTCLYAWPFSLAHVLCVPHSCTPPPQALPLRP